jgi:predicted NBD/HSP70 family sugar kinase
LSERFTNLAVRSQLSAIGQRSETVRRANLSAIVRELHLRGPLTRSSLVVRTGLTRSAIRGLVGELVEGGLASEAPGAPLGTPGRPSSRVRLDPDRAVAIGLEISVDTLAAAVVGLGGVVQARERVARPRAHLSVDEIVGDLAELVGRIWPIGLPTTAAVGIGVAVVGIVRRSDGLVTLAPNLGWRDVPLAERLRGVLDVRAPISVANDADLGALAELRRGAAAGYEDVLFVSGEVGVGGGLILGGRPLTGAAGFGGEVGHLPVNPLGVPCGCGSVGCWETEVGERALLLRAGHAPDEGRDGVEAVLREADAGSPRALAALENVGRWLGRGLAGLVNIFNPRLIVLGGLLGRIHPYVDHTLEDSLDHFALPAPRALVRIVPARLGVDAPLLGAAELALDPLLADPASWLRPRSAVAVPASA